MTTKYFHIPDSGLVDQPHKVREFVDSIAIAGLRRNPPSLYIDLEGERLCRYGTICIMQVFDATTRQTWLIDVYALRHAVFVTRGTSSGLTFKNILEDPWTPKVFFDVRNDSDALYAEYGIDLQGIEDLQLMEFAARPFGDSRLLLMGLAGCIERDLPLGDATMVQFLKVKEKGRKLFAPELNGSYAVFKQRPLPEAIKEYCLFDVKFMSVLWHHYNHQMCPQTRERMVEESAARVAESQSPNYKPEGPGKAFAPTGWSGSPWLDEALRKYKEKSQLDFRTKIPLEFNQQQQQLEVNGRQRQLEVDRQLKWDMNRDLQSELAYFRDLRGVGYRAQRPQQPW